MVRAKINGVQCEIKTKWEEVDPVILSDCPDFKSELKCLTTVPHETIDRADDVQLFPLRTLISFIDEVENMPVLESDSISGCERIIKNNDKNRIFGCYEHLEIAKKELGTDHKPYRKILNIAMLYYPEEKNPVRLIGHGLHLINQIANFLSSYEDMLFSEPEADEINAGLETLSVFGSWGTAYVMAGKNPLEVQKILDSPAELIYTSLYYNWNEARYQKALMEAKYKKG